MLKNPKNEGKIPKKIEKIRKNLKLLSEFFWNFIFNFRHFFVIKLKSDISKKSQKCRKNSGKNREKFETILNDYLNFSGILSLISEFLNN